MAKYRVKQRFELSGSTSFEVQKRVWYIPFWYNFNNIDGETTGFYDTFEKAKNAIEKNKYKTKSLIIPVE